MHIHNSLLLALAITALVGFSTAEAYSSSVPTSAVPSSVYAQSILPDDPDPEDDPEEDDSDHWDILEALTAILCMIVECNVDPWHPASDVTSEAQVISRIESQISSFNANGILPGLSPSQRLQGASDAATLAAFLVSFEGLLDQQLETQYLVALDGMIEQLVAP